MRFMSKKQEEAMVPASTALARPDWVKSGDTRGTEDMTMNDLRPPRLAVAQGLSPQLDPNKPEFISGLQRNDMFNDVSNEIYGTGPLVVQVVRRDPPRWIEFIPREQGGGVKDFDVPRTDPRTQFTTNDKGERVKPVATQFYDYVLLVWRDDRPDPEMIALSLKSWSVKIARQFNALLKLANEPIWARLYAVKAVSATTSKGTFGVFRFDLVGYGSQKQYAAGEAIFNDIKDKNLVIEREPGDDDPDEL